MLRSGIEPWKNSELLAVARRVRPGHPVYRLLLNCTRSVASETAPGQLPLKLHPGSESADFLGTLCQGTPCQERSSNDQLLHGARQPLLPGKGVAILTNSPSHGSSKHTAHFLSHPWDPFAYFSNLIVQEEVL